MGYSTHRDPDGTVWVRNPDGTWIDPVFHRIRGSVSETKVHEIQKLGRLGDLPDPPEPVPQNNGELFIAIAIARTEREMLSLPPKPINSNMPTEDWRKPGTHRVKPRRPQYKGHFL